MNGACPVTRDLSSSRSGKPSGQSATATPASRLSHIRCESFRLDVLWLATTHAGRARARLARGLRCSDTARCRLSQREPTRGAGWGTEMTAAGEVHLPGGSKGRAYAKWGYCPGLGTRRRRATRSRACGAAAWDESRAQQAQLPLPLSRKHEDRNTGRTCKKDGSWQQRLRTRVVAYAALSGRRTRLLWW